MPRLRRIDWQRFATISIEQQSISIIVAVQALASSSYFDLELPGSVAGLLLLPNQDTIEQARGFDNITVVESASRSAISQTIAQIVQLRPQSETIYVVGGNNGDDLLYVNQVEQAAQAYQGSIEFQYLIGVEPNELEIRLRQLNSNDTVLSLPFSAYTDSNGELASVGSVYFELMIDSVPAPLFGIHDRLLGLGRVCQILRGVRESPNATYSTCRVA